MTQHSNSALALIDAGHGAFRQKVVAQCRVCVSPLRPQVEQQLIEGLAPIEVVRRLPADVEISVRSVRNHVTRLHLPVDRVEVARYVEERRSALLSELATLAIVEAKRHVDEALLTLAAGHLRLRQGELVVSASDTINAVRYLRECEGHDSQMRKIEQRAQRLDDQRLDAVSRLLDIVGEVAGDAMLRDVLDRAFRDDVMEDAMLAERLFRWRDHPVRH